MQIANLAKDVALEEEYEVVCQAFLRWLFLDSGGLLIVARVDHLIDFKVCDELLIPADEVDVTIEVAT